MRHLTLFERQEVEIGAVGSVSQEDADALERLQPFLPKGTITWGRQTLQFGPFCGVLRAGDLTIELLPKVGSSATSRGVLIAMLYATNTLASRSSDGTLGNQRLHLLDQFILDFCDQIAARLKRGTIARYEQHNDNLRAVRGRLNVTDHVRVNAFDRSRIYCQFDERTIDNHYNRILKFVLQRLRMVAFHSTTKGSVTALLHRFDEVGETAVRASDVDALKFDRLNAQWQSVFERASWLLKGLFPDVRSGQSLGSCLLFNMERLFEKFIGQRVQQSWERLSRGGYTVGIQAPQKYLAASDKAFLLKPDITITQDGRPVAIFDTKWKQLGGGAITAEITSEDVYQMTTYAMRYGCRSVTLIYPTSGHSHDGRSKAVRLAVPGQPELRICEVDIERLAQGDPLPEPLLPSGLRAVTGEAHGQSIVNNQLAIG